MECQILKLLILKSIQLADAALALMGLIPMCNVSRVTGLDSEIH
jgi:hypothetical protein